MGEEAESSPSLEDMAHARFERRASTFSLVLISAQLAWKRGGNRTFKIKCHHAQPSVNNALTSKGTAISRRNHQLGRRTLCLLQDPSDVKFLPCLLPEESRAVPEEPREIVSEMERIGELRPHSVNSMADLMQTVRDNATGEYARSDKLAMCIYLTRSDSASCAFSSDFVWLMTELSHTGIETIWYRDRLINAVRG